MATISRLAIKAEVINLRQALEKQQPNKPDCIFVSSEEEIVKAKKRYGENLDGITVLKWNIGSKTNL